MSIAVSVVVKPSRWLLTMVGCMCAVVIFVGILVISEKIGELSSAIRLLDGAICIAVALLGFVGVISKRKTFHIDISGVGQIRLIEDIGLDNSILYRHQVYGPEAGKIVRLMGNSTCWPFFLLLRFQDDNQRIVILPILPDCLTENSFRALSVACRWIAAHNIQAEDRLSD